MQRRQMLQGLFLGTAALSVPGLNPAWGYEVTKTDAEWKKILSPAAYNVLRRQGTEIPGTSPLLNEHRKGIFSCAGCDLDNYSSATKFESGTGWPSFWQPLPNAVQTAKDDSLGME